MTANSTTDVYSSDTFRFVEFKDFPGQRIDDENDVAWPLRYRFLSKEEASKQLFSLAKARSTVLDTARGLTVDSISFQPCPSYNSEDRHAVCQLDVHGKFWSFTAIFDGHVGPATAEYAAQNLPLAIQHALRIAVDPSQQYSLDPEVVSAMLSSAITAFDQGMIDDVLALFPGGLDGLSNLTDEEIKKIMNDSGTGGANYAKGLHLAHGTTAIVALVDPGHENLWVANLGDCEAILVSETAAGEVGTDLLSTGHNGQNPAEIERQKREHPGEDECALNNRSMGLYAIFRGLGDAAVKLPPVLVQRVLRTLDPPGFPPRVMNKWDTANPRNLTPPYLSNVSEVTHRALGALPGVRNSLLMYSDGVAERYEGREDSKVRECAEALVKGGETLEGGSDNLALHVLRQVLDANNVERLSLFLTLEVDIPWIDDVTIIVQNL